MEENIKDVYFSDLGLSNEILDSIDAMGFDKPTPIQAKAIPIVLSGDDLIACAQTGTGKTAAFVIPMLDQILSMGNKSGVKGLIITPTRELAMQIDQMIEGLSYFTGVSSVAIYGGSNKMDWDKQMAAIKRGVDIIVATPGRFLMHGSLGYLDFSTIEILVLDEADKMLDMGFHHDILRIIKELPENNQRLMFSATMPPKIRELAHKILKKPQEITLQVSKPAERIHQQAYIVYDDQKIPLLMHLLRHQSVENMIIFTSSKMKADEVHKNLSRLKLSVNVIHSDKTQEERQDVLRDFKNKSFQILVATDILSRGIDIDSLSHVVNFDVPHDAEDYVHRIGRTARAGANGAAITFVGEREQRKFQVIERFLGKSVEKPQVPAELGETPFYSAKSGKSNAHRSNSPRNRQQNQRNAPPRTQQQPQKPQRHAQAPNRMEQRNEPPLPRNDAPANQPPIVPPKPKKKRPPKRKNISNEIRPPEY